jgi:hypothetical protein
MVLEVISPAVHQSIENAEKKKAMLIYDFQDHRLLHQSVDSPPHQQRLGEAIKYSQLFHSVFVVVKFS